MTTLVGDAVVVGPRTGMVPYEAAFRELFAVAYRTAYRVLGVRAEAEDVAQEACARACSRWNQVGEHAVPWTVRVAGNLAIDVVRARRRRPPPPGEFGSDPRLEERLDLQKALLSLPRRQRQAVVCRYLADLSEAETARVLGMSLGTVKSTSARGLAALKSVMRKEGAERCSSTSTTPPRPTEVLNSSPPRLPGGRTSPVDGGP